MKQVGDTYRYNWFEIKKIFRSDVVGIGGQAVVFARSPYAYKIFHKFAPKKYEEFKYLGSNKGTNFDREIDMLEHLKRIKDPELKKSLPLGSMFNNCHDFIGILYPYHEGFDDGRKLLQEPYELLFENIKQILRLNMILSERGICNHDLKFSNTMYKDNEVRLVDLDGCVIDRDYSRSLYFFYTELMVGLGKRIEDPKLLEEIKKIICYDYYALNSDHNLPIKQIEFLEKERIL